MPKRNKPIRILAIDPGTKYMGIAVLENTNLIWRGIKALKHRKISHRFLKEARKIILELFEDYEPYVLVLEKTFFVQSKRSSLLNVLTDEIKHLGKRKGLRIFEYAPTTVRKFICQDGKATKMETARIIATRYYPWLYYDYAKEKGKAWFKEKYWLHAFDAIALGLMCYYHDLDGKIAPRVT